MWIPFGIILISFVTLSSAGNFNVTFTPSPATVYMENKINVSIRLDDLPDEILKGNDSFLQIVCENSMFASIPDQNNIILIDQFHNKSWLGSFNISGLFLGRTKITVKIKGKNNVTINGDTDLEVIVLRKQRVIDHIFTGSLILLVSILYINFGAAIDLPALKTIILRPVGPIIALCAQFLFMPLMSYGLAHLLFPKLFDFQLGMFYTGISPAGGASNIWTLMLGGNLSLSIVMTTISTLAAFGMMPLWIFTLGKTIFDKANLRVPYDRITGLAFGLIIPLGIGILIQKYFPKLTRILVRVLKPLSAMLIIFIIVFAIVTNIYLFQLFTWEIVVAGLGLPWLGFIFGWILSKIFKRSNPDTLAIAIETGVQNTGIAISLLRLTLTQPEADRTTVIPVAVAIMTPFPLLLLYIIQRFRNRLSSERQVLVNKDTPPNSPISDESYNQG